MKALGLLGARQQAHTVESIKPVIAELRPMFPKAGVVEMKNILFHERQMKVPRKVSLYHSIHHVNSAPLYRSVIYQYFLTYESRLLRERKVNRLRRKHLWVAGNSG